MLDDMKPDLWQVEHLPDPVANINSPDQILITTTTHPRNVIDNPARVGNLLQVSALVTGLTARFTARRTPKALRRRFAQPV
jgi:hypothetical protein